MGGEEFFFFLQIKSHYIEAEKLTTRINVMHTFRCGNEANRQILA